MSKPISSPIPIITIDGPSGTGKGTVGWLLAQKLKVHFLDSGALYRALASAVLFFEQSAKIDLENELSLLNLLKDIKVSFVANHDGSNYHTQVFFAMHNLSDHIRSEECGKMASKLAINPHVRAVLLDWQRNFAYLPGLVTDGRDMGTVVFPDANLKIFLMATAEERANRRYKQLKEQGINVSLDKILADLEERDERDIKRSVSPLKPAQDAVLIDTTKMGINEVLQEILGAASTLC